MSRLLSRLLLESRSHRTADLEEGENDDVNVVVAVVVVGAVGVTTSLATSISATSGRSAATQNEFRRDSPFPQHSSSSSPPRGAASAPRNYHFLTLLRCVLASQYKRIYRPVRGSVNSGLERQNRRIS